MKTVEDLLAFLASRDAEIEGNSRSSPTGWPRPAKGDDFHALATEVYAFCRAELPSDDYNSIVAGARLPPDGLALRKMARQVLAVFPDEIVARQARLTDEQVALVNGLVVMAKAALPNAGGGRG
jgi:hypothetical protein